MVYLLQAYKPQVRPIQNPDPKKNFMFYPIRQVKFLIIIINFVLINILIINNILIFILKISKKNYN